MQSYPECIWEVSTRYKSTAAESRIRSRQWELHHCSIVYTVRSPSLDETLTFSHMTWKIMYNIISRMLKCFSEDTGAFISYYTHNITTFLHSCNDKITTLLMFTTTHRLFNEWNTTYGYTNVQGGPNKTEKLPFAPRCRRRRRKKTGAGDSLFARLNNTITMPTLMKIWL